MNFLKVSKRDTPAPRGVKSLKKEMYDITSDDEGGMDGLLGAGSSDDDSEARGQWGEFSNSKTGIRSITLDMAPLDIPEAFPASTKPSFDMAPLSAEDSNLWGSNHTKTTLSMSTSSYQVSVPMQQHSCTSDGLAWPHLTKQIDDWHSTVGEMKQSDGSSVFPGTEAKEDDAWPPFAAESKPAVDSKQDDNWPPFPADTKPAVNSKQDDSWPPFTAQTKRSGDLQSGVGVEPAVEVTTDNKTVGGERLLKQRIVMDDNIAPMDDVSEVFSHIEANLHAKKKKKKKEEKKSKKAKMKTKKKKKKNDRVSEAQGVSAEIIPQPEPEHDRTFYSTAPLAGYPSLSASEAIHTMDHSVGGLSAFSKTLSHDNDNKSSGGLTAFSGSIGALSLTSSSRDDYIRQLMTGMVDKKQESDHEHSLDLAQNIGTAPNFEPRKSLSTLKETVRDIEHQSSRESTVSVVKASGPQMHMIQNQFDPPFINPSLTSYDEGDEGCISTGRLCCCFVVLAMILGVLLYFFQADFSKTGQSTGRGESIPAEQTNLDFYIKMFSPLSGADIFLDKESPQYLAVQWLAETDELYKDSNASLETLTQRYSLTTLYYSLTSGEFSDLPRGWLDPNFHECDWTPGLECDMFENFEQRILTSINLKGMNYVGYIADEIQYLSGLQTLMLGNNTLKGTIPNEISRLRLLQHLEMDNAEITGSIPSGIMQLMELTTLDLSQNLLTSTIPDALLDLSGILKLSKLDVSNNKLSGTIPASLAELEELTWVDFSRNNLNGQIIGFPNVNVTHINLGSNNFSGSLPASFGSQLMYINYNDNAGLTGTIPPELAQASNLKYFSAQNCSLNGTIPDEIATLTNLESLLLNNNGMMGSVPSVIGLMTSLRVLDLSSNIIQGILPFGMGLIVGLEYLSLHSNGIAGTIPQSFSRLSNLRIVQLQGNKLQGNWPLCSLGDAFDKITNFTVDCAVSCSCCNACV